MLISIFSQKSTYDWTPSYQDYSNFFILMPIQQISQIIDFYRSSLTFICTLQCLSIYLDY